MHTTEEVRNQLKSAEAKLAEAQAELAAAQAKLREAEKPKEWEPTRGDWIVSAKHLSGWCAATRESGTIVRHDLGLSYPTWQAAEAAKNYLSWYAMLLNLAAQVNPSGKPGGKWYVYLKEGRWLDCYTLVREPVRVFETREAAYKATEILNRQNGVLGGIPCPF